MKCYLYLFFDDVIMDHYSSGQIDIWVVYFPFINFQGPKSLWLTSILEKQWGYHNNKKSCAASHSNGHKSKFNNHKDKPITQHEESPSCSTQSHHFKRYNWHAFPAYQLDEAIDLSRNLVRFQLDEFSLALE